MGMVQDAAVPCAENGRRELQEIIQGVAKPSLKILCVELPIFIVLILN